MENTSLTTRTYSNNENNYNTYYNRENISYGKPEFNPILFSLTAEGGKDLFRYLKSFNLSKEPDLMILPPNHHYFYDEDDLKSVRTLLNLKKLNHIKDLDAFLQTLFLILPPDVNFIGCFSEKKTDKWDRFLTGLSDRFLNLLDSRTDHFIDQREVSELLVKYGFRIVDMSEMNGITYFYSQRISQDKEKRA